MDDHVELVLLFKQLQRMNLELCRLTQHNRKRKLLPAGRTLTQNTKTPPSIDEQQHPGPAELPARRRSAGPTRAREDSCPGPPAGES